MNYMEIITKPLHVLKSIDYLIEVLEQVVPIDLETQKLLLRGSMVALASKDVSKKQLYDFAHGGLLAQTCIESSTTRMVEPVVSTVSNLACNLTPMLAFDSLTHDPLRTIEEAGMIDGEPVMIEGSLFYVNRQLRTTKDLENMIRRNTLSWHFLMLFGSYPTDAQLAMRSAVQGAVCIVVGAYDGESYLIWQPD